MQDLIFKPSLNLDKARTLYDSAIVIDNALGFEPELEVPYKWDLLTRYTKAGFTYLTLSVATDATSLEKTMQYMAMQHAKLKAAPEQFIFVEKVEHILQAKQEGKLGVGFMFQGTHPMSFNW